MPIYPDSGSKHTPAAGTAVMDLPPNRYAFTITLSGLLRRKHSIEQYDVIAEHVHEILFRLAFKHTLVAELTKNADIHFHGLLEAPGMCLTQVSYVMKNRLRRCKYIGFSCIKLCDDEDGWILYMRKSFDEFCKLVNRRPIIYDGMNLYPPTEGFDKWLVTLPPRI